MDEILLAAINSGNLQTLIIVGGLYAMNFFSNHKDNKFREEFRQHKEEFLQHAKRSNDADKVMLEKFDGLDKRLRIVEAKQYAEEHPN